MSKDKKEAPKTGIAIVQILVVVALLWYFFGGGLDKQVANDLQDIHNKVATDSVDQYWIAKRNGSSIDACVQAGLVSASYLQAKDESNYQKWKSIESADCARAGVPR